MTQSVLLTQMSNAGVCIAGGGSLWLVDAMHGGVGPYPGTTPAGMATVAAQAQGRMVRLALTHLHPDHAGAEQIRRLADMVPLTVYCADPHIREWDLGKAGLVPLADGVAVTTDGDSLTAVPVPHLSPGRFTLPHYALLLEIADVRLAFCGDGAPDADAFGSYGGILTRADAAVCCYAYGFTRRNLAFCGQTLRPRILVLNHIPPPGTDARDACAALRDFLQKAQPPMPVHAFCREGDAVRIGHG
ncbi:MAG TPA: MBL fold metallo-hydrolase [Candidatus Limnocylindria bacterium]|nr:MBL fold metallo-hydrolase [Candidatus Limnocylindria bacterium]